MDHLRSGVQDHPGKHGETLSLLEIQKTLGVVMNACYPSCLGGWGMRITWSWEVEVAVSWDCAIALHPGWQRKTLSKKKIYLDKEDVRLDENGGRDGMKESNSICILKLELMEFADEFGFDELREREKSNIIPRFGFCLFCFVFETGSHSVLQARVYWYSHRSL